jgi:hypothetical protein
MRESDKDLANLVGGAVVGARAIAFSGIMRMTQGLKIRRAVAPSQRQWNDMIDRDSSAAFRTVWMKACTTKNTQDDFQIFHTTIPRGVSLAG